jgi:outer membrane protein OmpA-like peptidoglycan-associated protein
MSSNQNVIDAGSGSGLHKWVAILLALLLVLMWFLGYGPGGSKCNPGKAEAPLPTAATPAPIAVAPTPAPTSAPAATVAAAAAPASASAAAPASAQSAVPDAKVYFGLDKIDLPKDVDKTLGDVVAYLKANSNAKGSISGFHDPSGNKAHNEDLALNRARAVRGALEKLGIPNDRVLMQKPIEATGTGDPAHARRVEVTIAKP